MKEKKIIIAVLCIILIIAILLGILIFNKNTQINETEFKEDSSVIYDKEGNIIYDTSRQNEITEVVKDVYIQGMVELHHNGYIYIFNGQHFGEFGFEMEEYTRANMILAI